MLVFRSEEHIERWLKERSLARGGTMSLEQCWQLANAWYADKLAPDWRRKTLDEAMAAFAQIGLVGDFWDLSKP